MEKTIKIDDKEIRFKTSLSWVFVFKAQFGYDPLMLIIPLFKSIINVLIKLPGGFEDLSREKLQELANQGNLDSFDLDELLYPLYNLEFSKILQLVWALAKNADESIEEPEKWYAQFKQFPLDSVLKEIGPMILESVVSTKKSKALMGAVGAKKQTKPHQ